MIFPFILGKYAAFLNFTSELDRKHFRVVTVIAISEKGLLKINCTSKNIFIYLYPF